MRPEISAELVRARACVDFVEVVAETCFTQGHARREAVALAALWPVVPHGVKLSLGSAAGIDMERARRLGVLARELRAPAVSEHVAFTRAGGREIGHLTALPRTMEAVRVVAKNVAAARRVLPDVPLLLENVAWTFAWPESPHDAAMDEASFYAEIVEHTGCELLLDLGNLYANAVNEGRDAGAVLAQFPLQRVGMMHLAGGVWEDGFFFDTHAHEVSRDVMDLARVVRAVRPDAPLLIERDANFCWKHLSQELEAVRALEPDNAVILSGAKDPLRGKGQPAPSLRGSFAALRMTEQQEAASAMLVDAEPEPSQLAANVGAIAIRRARDILQRKRVDDAMPLLTRLGRARGDVRALAEHAVAMSVRPVRGAGPSDAWRIAVAAARDPQLAEAARLDMLVLRARFSGLDAGTASPRRAPFWGYARLDDGTRVRASKGLGAQAPVHIREGR